MKKIAWCISLVLSLLHAQAHALILTGIGNKPVNDHGWPSGAVKVANLTCRIGWWEGPPFGGGEWHFEFVGNTKVFQRTLDLFAKIGAPALDLFVHDGTQNSFVLDPNHQTTTNNIDWSFTVWVPDRWNALYGPGKPMLFSDDPNAGRPMPPPRIDLYLNERSTIAFDQIIRAPNISLHDERAVTAGVDTRSGTVLQVTVSDARSHSPIAGARVIVTARDQHNQYTQPFTNAVSDAQGVARITGLPAGVFQLSAVAPGYAEAALDYGDYPAHSFRKFDVALALVGSISGTAVNEQGTGVSGLRLVVANTFLTTNAPYRTLRKPETTTDAAGKFTLEGLPMGLAQIWVRSTNYFQTNIFALQPVPSRGIILGVRPTGALYVRVIDSDGQGMSQLDQRSIQISVRPSTGEVRGSWGGSANVRADGTYLFTGVHPDTYDISILNTTKQTRVTVVPLKQTEVIIRLP